MNKKNKIMLSVFGFLLMSIIVVGSTTIRDTLSDMAGINNTGNFITTDPWIDIRAYGAIADDSTSDLAAFSDILNDYTTDFAIYIPCGVWDIDGTINFTNSHQRVTMFGEGDCSIIKLMDNTDDQIIYLAGADYVTLRDFTVNGNNANNAVDEDAIYSGWGSNHNKFLNLYIHDTSGCGIFMNGGKDVHIDNCKFENIGTLGVNNNVYGMAIKLEHFSGVQITNNEIDTFYGDGGIFLSGVSIDGSGYGTENVIISDNLIRGGQTDQTSGIHIHQGKDISILNNYILDNEPGTLGINGIFSGSDTHNMLFDGNFIHNVSGVGIEIKGNHSVISNNHIVLYTNGTNGNDANGMYISSDDVICTGNYIEDAPNHGIYIANAKNNLLISNNIIKNSGGRHSADRSGIRFVITSGVRNNTIISNNHIFDDQTVPTQQYGIYSTGAGSLENIQIYGNNFHGNNVSDVAGIATSEMKEVTFNTGINNIGNLTISDILHIVNTTVTAPDTNKWCCGVNNTGSFVCTSGVC